MAKPKEEVPEEEVVPSEPEVQEEEIQEPEQPQEEAPEPEPEPEEEPEEKPPSRRESLRIQQVIERAKQGAYTPKAPEVPAELDYKTALQGDPEVIQQIEAEAKRRSDAAYAEGMKQANAIKWETRLEVDAPRIEAKFPQLNKDSETFNPVVADAINKWYLSQVGFDAQTGSVANPNLRYSEFVEGVMELADEMAGQKVSTTRTNIAKQAAATGLRPDGSAAKRMNLNKAPEQMTDEELAAKMQSIGLA